MKPRLPLILVPLLLTLLTLFGRPAAAQENDGPFPPHRIAENLYYVGSQGLASYLVTTPRGHILINSCFAATVPLIQESVKKLGFRFQDIKILLTSHAHNDHVEGNALVRRLTGANVQVMEGDEGIVREGGKGDFQYNSTWEPCPVDRVLKDGDTVKLGNAVLTAHKTPGHTRGCTTWTLNVRDGGKTLRAVIIGSPNVNPGYKLVNNTKYPAIAEDYAKTFEVLKSLPCDLFLGAHGDYYNLKEKYPRLQTDKTKNPFVDPEGYKRYVADREAAYLAALAKSK
jgi:metallo-beta-lactamase class B